MCSRFAKPFSVKLCRSLQVVALRCSRQVIRLSRLRSVVPPVVRLLSRYVLQAMANVHWQTGLKLITKEPCKATIRKTVQTLKKDEPLDHEFNRVLRLVQTWPLLLLRAREMIQLKKKIFAREEGNELKAWRARSKRADESSAETARRVAKRKQKDSERKARRKAAAKKRAEESE